MAATLLAERSTAEPGGRPERGRPARGLRDRHGRTGPPDLADGTEQRLDRSLAGLLFFPADQFTDLRVARNQDGRLEVFAIAPDNRVFQTWQTAPNNGWIGRWQTIPQRIV